MGEIIATPEVWETLARTEQPLKMPASPAPPPTQATKVMGVGRHRPTHCQPVLNAVARVSVTPLAKPAGNIRDSTPAFSVLEEVDVGVTDVEPLGCGGRKKCFCE